MVREEEGGKMEALKKGRSEGQAFEKRQGSQENN